MATHKRTRVKVCAVCETEFIGHGRAKYCSSKCVNRAREDRRAISCSRCGGRMWNARVIADEPMCQPCRRVASPKMHGDSGYRRGCRCDTCRAGAAARNRDYARRFKERTGTSLRAKYPDGSVRHWISAERRASIYERDGWVCWICGELTERFADVNSDFAPSLDHVVPRVHGGTHESENLRCAHRVCNAGRGAREVSHGPD